MNNERWRGQFQRPIYFGTGTSSISVAVGDFNGDGKQDLAIADTDSNNVSILLRDCAATPTPTPTPTATPTATPTPTPTPTPTATVQVTVQTTAAGLEFTVDGTTYSSTQTFSWVPGSSHTIATTSPQNGGTGVHYAWTRWSDNGPISHTVAPTTNKTYTATFKMRYYLTMSHGTGGTVSPASGWRGSGPAVSISATSTSGYSFTNWSGSGIGSYSWDKQSGFNYNEQTNHGDGDFHS